MTYETLSPNMYVATKKALGDSVILYVMVFVLTVLVMFLVIGVVASLLTFIWDGPSEGGGG